MRLCLVCNFQTASDEQTNCPHDGSGMVKVGEDPLLGMLVEERYRIESLIGQGSAGAVYKARQELIGRDVAVKVLHDYLVSDDEFVKRFKQEARAASRLSHPNIISIYDFGLIPLGRRPYIAMDLLDGTPLSQLITQYDHIPIEEAMPIFKMVCQALAEAHRQGVVHRDIKPENIVLVERAGKSLFPIVVDFGIARLLQEESEAARITRTGTVCGSPTYMSPEQCTSSKVDHRSDIYSLAVVLYETLTGSVPFYSDELVKVMTMHLLDPPPTLKAARPDLQFPEQLEIVLRRALAKKPEERFNDMDEFAYVLEEAVKVPQKTMVGMPAVANGQAVPGPLAAVEIGKSQATAQEVLNLVKPSPTIRDLANRALEEMIERAKAAETEEGRAVESADNILARQNAPARFRKSTEWERAARRFLPTVFTACALCAVVAFAINEAKVFRLTPERHTNASIQALIKEGRFEEALPALQQLKQKGQLSRTQAEDLNKVRVSVAKKYAEKKQFSDAISLLKQIPRNSRQADKAKSLIYSYKNQ